MTHTFSSDEEPVRHDFRIYETVLKSSFSGVAATVLAITVFSPAGLGGLIGTSVANGFGMAADTPDVVSFPAVPAPLSESELTDIRARLAVSMTAIDSMRAITDDEIDHLRALAAVEDDAVLAAESEPRQQDVDLANLLLRDTQS